MARAQLAEFRGAERTGAEQLAAIRPRVVGALAAAEADHAVAVIEPQHEPGATPAPVAPSTGRPAST